MKKGKEVDLLTSICIAFTIISVVLIGIVAYSNYRINKMVDYLRTLEQKELVQIKENIDGLKSKMEVMSLND